MSETILNEYLDFTNYNHYPLNVIDNDCMTYINLETNEVEMNFNNYDEFYTKNSEIVKFKWKIGAYQYRYVPIFMNKERII